MKIDMKWGEFPSWLKGGFIGLFILFIPTAFFLAFGLPVAMGYQNRPDDTAVVIYEIFTKVLLPFAYVSDRLYSLLTSLHIPGPFFVLIIIYFCFGAIIGKLVGNYFSKKGLSSGK